MITGSDGLSFSYTRAMLRLGSIKIDPPLVLAPMAGITDRDFRLIIRRVGGCGLVSMEFISSEGLLRQTASTLRMLHFSDVERPISIQIYGSDPARMGDAARMVAEMGADVCDINMGCPANKVLKGCAGAGLMADPKRALNIVRSVRRAISIPLTVKMRLGIREESKNYLEIGRICEGEGVDAVTLHPRTAKQQYSGAACWEHITTLKQSIRIPVIGNGDVTDAAKTKAMFEETLCDAVMIGRGSLSNPWIFSQSAALLGGALPQEPSLAERHSLVQRHFSEVIEREDERTALHKLRKFTSWYTGGIPEGRKLRRLLSELDSAQEVLAVVEEFFSERMAA